LRPNVEWWFFRFFKELPVPGVLKKNQNQRTGRFPALQKQQNQRTVGFEYFFKTLKEPSVFNKQL
jgi:hypothetical protein